MLPSGSASGGGRAVAAQSKMASLHGLAPTGVDAAPWAWQPLPDVGLGAVAAGVAAVLAPVQPGLPAPAPAARHQAWQQPNGGQGSAAPACAGPQVRCGTGGGPPAAAEVLPGAAPQPEDTFMMT
jgi:hypothetical protein